VRCGLLLNSGLISLPCRRDEHAFAAGARARLHQPELVEGFAA
jgi:hypothetical protein